MNDIVIKGLSKTFRTKIKEAGLKGSIKSLFSPNYKEINAVDNINLTIPKGQLVGFIGPNGAGKSTTLKMLTGILYPSDGEANVLGLTPWKERQKLSYKVGTVFGQRSQLWMHLPAQDSFDLFAAIYNLEEKEYRKRLSYLIKTFDIGEFVNVPVRKLSLGQRMRCDLVAALLHKPEVIYLDEPSIGLDILAKKSLREHIKKINREEKVTVILTSHDMDDIEEVCDRVIVINKGKIINDSTIDEMRKKYLHKKLITIHLKAPAKTLKLKGLKILEQTNELSRIEINTDIIEIKEVLSKITSQYQIEDIEISDPPIEDIIEEMYKK